MMQIVLEEKPDAEKIPSTHLLSYFSAKLKLLILEVVDFLAAWAQHMTEISLYPFANNIIYLHYISTFHSCN